MAFDMRGGLQAENVNFADAVKKNFPIPNENLNGAFYVSEKVEGSMSPGVGRSGKSYFPQLEKFLAGYNFSSR